MLDAASLDTGEFEEEDDDFDDDESDMEEEVIEEDEDVEVETVDSEEFEVTLVLLPLCYYGYHMTGRYWNLIRCHEI